VWRIDANEAMNEDIVIEGMEELLSKLERTKAEKVWDQVVPIATQEIRTEVGTYPPETQANMPPGNDGYRWYKRGFGVKTVTGKAYATSEKLFQKWYVKDRTLETELGNPASYSEVVHGKNQAKFHKERGWKQLMPVIEKWIPEIEKMLAKAADKLLGG
jgi:hypothetical protein